MAWWIAAAFVLGFVLGTPFGVRCEKIKQYNELHDFWMFRR